MIPAFLYGNGLPFEHGEPLVEMENAAHRLREFARRDGWRLDLSSRQLMDEMLGLAAAAEQQIAEQRARIRYLESLSVTDELTGLLNRRGFRGELDKALAGARRRAEHGLLVLCDLDHFKSINDTYGHPAGDAVLIAVAHLLHDRIRRSDAVARLGGDEFAILMPGSKRGEADAKTSAAKLKRAVNSLVVPWKGHQVPVSASFGWAPYGPTTKADSLILLADQAAYRNKPQRGQRLL